MEASILVYTVFRLRVAAGGDYAAVANPQIAINFAMSCYAATQATLIYDPANRQWKVHAMPFA